MASETAPPDLRFYRDDEVERPENAINGTIPPVVAADPENQAPPVELHEMQSEPLSYAPQDDASSLSPYPEPASLSNSIGSLVPTAVVNGTGSRHRNGTGEAPMSLPNGNTPRPQRPTGPARTPSNTYQPYAQRRPGQQNSASFSLGAATHGRDGSRQRPVGTATFKAQEKEYIRRLRQQNYSDYFDLHPVGDQLDSDSEGETPSSEGPFDGHDQEPNLFTYSEDLQPTADDLADSQNRERLIWHGMLQTVLTGDVVRQEKKRLIGSSEEQIGKTAQKAELWLGIRAKVCGRHLPVQRRMVDEARSNADRLINEIIHFSVAGESEAGKPPVEQVRDLVAKIEKVEGLYPSRAAFLSSQKTAASESYQEACDTVISWCNVNDMINTELSILRKWVGNDALDFRPNSDKATNDKSIGEDTSFLDRLMKEEGLKSLHDDPVGDGKELRKRSMLYGISRVIMKAKETHILNAEGFAKRHLPPYIEELLTLMSFPLRLIEEIIKVRLVYAKNMKESAQQNPMMLDQMISQFQVLLNLAIKIKQEYLAVSRPEPGWELPPCIDEAFDQSALDALKYYFKMLNWKLSGNKNTFKEAELLFQEWDFANEIGRWLNHGDVEVAEQFSSLTHKALNRLNLTFVQELKRKSKESIPEMTKRYKQVLDSVRVRQRMLQRFSRMLSNNYENACDFTIAFGPDKLQDLYDRLIDSGHFQVYTGSMEQEGVLMIASPSLRGHESCIQTLVGTFSYETPPDIPADSYVLLLRPENGPHWFGDQISLTVRQEPLDLRLGHMRLIAGGSQAILANARKVFLEAVDMQIDLVVEQRSTLHKVNQKLMENRKVAYKLSNAFMDSVGEIRAQTKGMDCQDLMQTCFIFATEFGQRSHLYMDSNRRQMNTMKLTKLALDWVSFICDDCVASDRKTFRWAVLALEFVAGMTRGRQILGLANDEFLMLQQKVSRCVALLVSHFDIMGARSSLAAQTEKQRMEALQLKQLNKGQILEDHEAAKYVMEHRLAELSRVDEYRKNIALERSALGRVLEVTNEVDRSLAWLSSTSTNFTMRWQQGRFVGGGTFGNVYAAMNLDTGHLMAVKEIRLQDPKLIPRIAGQIRDEMRVLEAVDHPNVVSYYGIEVHRDRVYIFMEFCSGGSLANLLEHGRIEDEQVITVYALQLLEGLAYLHDVKIAHRDIKPENILLDHNGIIKYVDFGAAKVIARHGRTLVNDLSSTKRNKSMTGTPMYMSPEVIKGESPGHFGAVDVWSLGCVILEMATGRRPWANLDNEWAIMYNIAQGNPPQLPTPDQLSPQGIDFLRRCFVRDSSKRATAVELLQHEWIMNIRNRVVEPGTPSDTSSSALSTLNVTSPL
ncbi:hypothetical protein VTK73DRAFT_7951 [Phialemonium thermophilum]|uniref:MAP kinase kinase kinase n=1 Tax=Phialemonium thermophilum TaxID=223376 RepID=A0ABR3XRF0_9PEZI